MQLMRGMSLKRLYAIRQRGYISAPDKHGLIKTYKPAEIDFSICELERNREKRREKLRTFKLARGRSPRKGAKDE